MIDSCNLRLIYKFISFIILLPFLNIGFELGLDFYLMLCGCLRYFLRKFLHRLSYLLHLAFVLLVNFFFLLFLISFIFLLLYFLSEISFVDFSLLVCSLLDGGKAHFFAVRDEDQLIVEFLSVFSHFIDTVVTSSLELQETI